MGDGEGHDRDGHGGAAHVDGGAEGDGDGVEGLVEAEPVAQGHVDRNVGRGASGEEGRDAAAAQALEDQRIGVAAQEEGQHQRIDDEHDGQHGADQQEQELAVVDEDGQAVLGDDGEHQAEDAEGGELDDEAHGVGHHVGKVAHEFKGAGLGELLQAHAEDDGPEEDADVVGAGDGVDGVVHHVLAEGGQNFAKAAGRRVGGASQVELDGDGEEEAAGNGRAGREEGAHDVEGSDGLELGAEALPGVGEGVEDEDENQHGGHGLQGADEEGAQDGDAAAARRRQADGRAQAQADEDAQDQADVQIPFDDAVHCFPPGAGFPFRPPACGGVLEAHAPRTQSLSAHLHALRACPQNRSRMPASAPEGLTVHPEMSGLPAWIESCSGLALSRQAEMAWAPLARQRLHAPHAPYAQPYRAEESHAGKF